MTDYQIISNNQSDSKAPIRLKRITVRDDRGGFFWADNALADSYLPVIGVNAFALYMLLARYADSTGKSYPSIKVLASQLQISARTVQKAIGTLVEHGLLQVESTFTSEGRQTSNTYRLLKVGGGRVHHMQGEGAPYAGGEGAPYAPPINKIYIEEDTYKKNTYATDVAVAGDPLPISKGVSLGTDTSAHVSEKPLLVSSKKQPKSSKPDVVFDSIAEHFFSAKDPVDVKAISGRVAKIKVKLLAYATSKLNVDKLDDEQYQQLSFSVGQFATWWDNEHNGIARPKDDKKFMEAWVAWRKTKPAVGSKTKHYEWREVEIAPNTFKRQRVEVES